MTQEDGYVTISKQDYNEIILELEKLNELQIQPPAHNVIANYQPMLATRAYWDTFFSKFVASVVSVKMWILFVILYYPYKLVLLGKISGDNYTNILLIVAPIVLGLREFAKSSSLKSLDNAPDAVPTNDSAETGVTSTDQTAQSTPSPAIKTAQSVLDNIRHRFNI